MAYGLQIWNDDGSIKIDDTLSRYKNLVEGTTTTNVKTTHANQSFMPLVFLRPLSYGVPFRVGTIYTDGFWVYRPTADTVDSSFEYVVASIFAGFAAPTSGFGFVVKGASGETLFSSSDKTMNIDFIGMFSVSSSPINATLPAPLFGRRFVAMLGPSIVRMVASGTYLTPYDMLIKLNSETSITVYEQVGPAFNTFTTASSYSVVGAPFLLISGYT